ncbi:ArsR/SmtB family transcription factor [Candidatus Nitrospira neomarina]|uniref:Metalloregulator ArsR/SmtB family transcription factor n=1 Tax=Candidatus Nitrospira neomarina TaxID=3020899 RepID=A0AA96GJX0_9BACT|nr:metalloregulator ArsR/SmtB family transcription factor [Candidatus Nitrospira neomarina]WNM62707.1 metalloregulator ArsR/SmtB family transcription factor [Candidatus Nitrospira neomarina]
MKIRNTSPSCASKLKVVSDPTRLAVLEALMSGQKNVGELMEHLEVEQSLLSHHLSVLRDNGLVEATREGKTMIYKLPEHVADSTSGKAINLGCCKISFG